MIYKIQIYLKSNEECIGEDKVELLIDGAPPSNSPTAACSLTAPLLPNATLRPLAAPSTLATTASADLASSLCGLALLSSSSPPSTSSTATSGSTTSPTWLMADKTGALALKAARTSTLSSPALPSSAVWSPSLLLSPTSPWPPTTASTPAASMAVSSTTPATSTG